jgi:hypothetical protein
LFKFLPICIRRHSPGAVQQHFQNFGPTLVFVLL